jgi:hypothetical protein
LDEFAPIRVKCVARAFPQLIAFDFREIFENRIGHGFSPDVGFSWSFLGAV